MPKPKRRPQQSRDRKVRTAQTMPPPESGISQTAAPRTATAPTPRVASQVATGAARHPYIAGELKKIGILTVILMAVLIILAFTLPRFI